MSNPTDLIAQRKQSIFGDTQLRFPSDLGAQAMVMNFQEYRYNPGGESFTTMAINSSSVILPIPINLNDETSLNVNGVEMGIPGAALYSALSHLKDNGATGAGQALYEKAAMLATASTNYSAEDLKNDSDLKKLTDSLKVYSRLIGRSVIDAIPGGGAAVDAVAGTSLNPFMTVDFNGVMLKQHTFTWIFSPRNETESEMIRQIIRTLKINSLPAYSDSVAGASESAVLKNALLTYPSLVNINFVGVDERHYYRFKPAMIKNIVATYNNGDKLHVLEGGKPATVQLNMTVLESAIHTKADYIADT